MSSDVLTQQSSATQRRRSASSATTASTVAQACRQAVAELENWSLWAYRDATGEEWDAQPACFITDYLLAVQCFAFAVYIGLFAATDKGDLAWYLMYFMALGISAALGGLLHHVAFEAMHDIAHKQEKHLVQTARVFGVNLSRANVDKMIEALWRVVLACSILTNFALLSLAASRHLPEAWAYSIIGLAAVFHTTNELLVYGVKLLGGLIQGLVWAPSKDKFNHNALSHVFLSMAATLMLIHFNIFVVVVTFLERTRSKLQAEWRLKVACLQRQHPDALSTALNNVRDRAVPSVEELEQRFQLVTGATGSKPSQKDLQHAMHSKTLTLSPNQRSKSFLRHKKAHTTPGPGKTTSPVAPNTRTGFDMLPVLTTTGETPFEVGLEPQVVPGQRQQQQYLLPVFRLPSVNVVSTASAMAAKEVQVVKEDVDRKQASETLGCPWRKLKLSKPSSTDNVPAPHHLHITNPIKHLLTSKSFPAYHEATIRDASSCSSANERALVVQFRRRKELVMEKIAGLALERWKQAVAYERQQEKLQAYLLYKGSKKLDAFLVNWSQRKLRRAWTKWWSDIVHEKALEGSVLELQSIQVIQRSWRAYRGRLFASLVRKQKLLAKQTTAAIKMQRMFRGGIARKFFKLKRVDKHRQAMATRIQALARGYIVRKRIKQMRDQRKKHLVASRVQAMYRGRKARRELAVHRRTQRLTKAAVIIQRRYRGRLGRAAFIRRRLDRMRDVAATKIQTMVRGRRARKVLANLREEERKRQAIRRAAAINIQRVYRGHRARLSTELKLMALRERNRMYAQAATKIQKMVRKRQAIQRVERLRQERAARFVLQAQTWVEYWNDDVAKWFYYNQETECEEEDARRQCAQCEDVFCDACYEKLHHSAKREKHTWKAIGSLRCIECEKMRATRWCSVCEDPYCLGCFTIIHSKGNKVNHQWTDMATFKKARKQQQMAQEEESAQTYDEYIQSSEYQYVTEYAVAEAAREAREAQAYAQSYNQEFAVPTADYNGWMTLVDETSGQSYYYNAHTGESQWV
ncbi:WW domain [Phytophthora cactorum]|nr:WW domain [Phytophthora cactorum]